MAIDKNSKAYQWLLDKWYTDEQITQMSWAVAWWQNAKDVVANTPTQSTPTSTGGSYVYNPTSWYYEKPNTPTQQPTEQPTPTTPEVKQETPVKQQETVGSTVPEVKQEWQLKPLSQEYYNQTNDNALNTIRDNLNQYKQSNPELFTNYDTFKRNFSYDARNEEQKNLLDDWYKGYQQWLELSATPTTDLYTEYQWGQISSAELENLRISNPTKYAELQAQINKWNIISAYDDDKGTADDMFTQLRNTWMQNMITNLTTAWSGASNIFDTYEEKMNSPEMMEISDQTTELQNQMENVQDDIASIQRSVEDEYEWTWATRSKINAIIADRTYDLQLQLRTLNSEYNKYATQYNNRMNQYQNEFQLELQEYQVNQQARQQQMSELWFAMDLMSFETPAQQQEREWNYRVKQQEYQNGDINSKDYSTRYKAALKWVENLLSQYEWIPMQRSSEQMAQDVLKAIDNWSTLGEELTKINKQIQSKPEYKYMYNQTFKPATTQWFWNSVSIWWMDYIEYNWKLYTSDQFNQEFGWVTKPANYNVVSEDVLMTYSDGRAWTFGSFMAKSANNDWNYIWQCGKFVNNYLQEIWAWRPFGNEDIKTREWWVNSDEWKVGTVALFDYNHYIDWKNYGHVGIVVSAPDKNGDFWVKDANFGSDGKIQTRKVNLKDVSLKWFIDPSLDQNWNRVSAGTSTTTATLSSVDEAKKNNYLEEARRWQMTNTDISKIGDIAAEQWWGEEWREALKQWQKWNLTDTQTKWIDKADSSFQKNIDVQDFDKAKNQFRQLAVALNDTSWVWDMSAIFTFMKTLDPTSVVREAEFDAAANTIWTVNWDAILQKLEKNINWQFLTDEQREQFKTVAKEFIKIKADAYQKQYDRLSKKYEWLGVDIGEWWPVNTAKELLDIIGWWDTTTNTSPTSWNDWLNKSSDVFKLTTNIWWNRLPSNFYQK